MLFFWEGSKSHPGQKLSDLEPGWAFYSSQFGATRLGDYKTTPGPPPPSFWTLHGSFTAQSSWTIVYKGGKKTCLPPAILKRSVRSNWSSSATSRPTKQVARKSAGSRGGQPSSTLFWLLYLAKYLNTDTSTYKHGAFFINPSIDLVTHDQPSHLLSTTEPTEGEGSNGLLGHPHDLLSSARRSRRRNANRTPSCPL